MAPFYIELDAMSATPAAAALLERQTQHLASLLEAVQRCVYFLEAADQSIG